jgi:glycerol kinase
MNPFNHQPLTMEQLKKDCLANLTIDQKPVKSSRLFMGHIHDVNVNRLCEFFTEKKGCYKNIEINEDLLKKMLSDAKSEKVFFRKGVPSEYVDESVDLSQFRNFSNAYHRLIFDLTQLNAASINLISSPGDGVTSLYVSGGFARNIIFVRLLASFFPEKEVYTSEIDNASALGAAMVMQSDIGQPASDLDLNIKKWDSLL